MSTPTQNVDPLGDDEVAAVDDAPAQAFREAMTQLGELKAYASQYVAAKTDLARLGLRKAMIGAALGIMALFAGAAMVITLMVLLLNGLAQLIASALGGRAWAGNLIVGAGLLLIMATAAWISLHRLSGVWRDATVKRYERRYAQQRNHLNGHDAQRRSAESGPEGAHGN